LGLAASLLGRVYGADGSALAAAGPVFSAALYIILGLSLLDILHLPSFTSVFSAALYIILGLSLLDILQLPSFLPSASSLVPAKNAPTPDGVDGADSTGYKGEELLKAFAFGASSALVASPCATPVLASLLAFVSSNKVDPTAGAALLFAYSTGYTAPVLAAGVATGSLKYTAPILAAGVATGSLKSLLSLKSSFRWVTPVSGAVLVAYGTYSALDHLVPV
ncbi:cytochrome c assembly protein, partial [Baffinella frigidus]